MQDNASCHTAKSVKTFIPEEDFIVMEWPAQSPDMNPIDNVWILLNERAKEKNRNVWEEYLLICKILIRAYSKICSCYLK